MQKWIKYGLMCSCLFTFYKAFSQQKDSSASLSITLETQYGIFMPHVTKVAHLLKGHAWGTEIALRKYNHGNQYWHHLFKYPETGVSFIFMNTGNSNETGFGIAIIPHVNYSFNPKGKVKGQFQFGYGLGYLSKIYDRNENIRNIAIASRINATIQFKTLVSIPISKELTICPTLNFQHFSNGAYKTPNLGLNFVMLGLGIKHNFKNKPQIIVPDTTVFRFKKIRPMILYTMGLKELNESIRKKYFTSTLSINFRKNLNARHRLGLAVELFLDRSIEQQFLLRNEIVESFGFLEGISLSYEYINHRFSGFVHFGSYIPSIKSPHDIFYHRIGSRYAINEKISLNLSLKTHFASADYLELGVAYQL